MSHFIAAIAASGATAAIMMQMLMVPRPRVSIGKDYDTTNSVVIYTNSGATPPGYLHVKHNGIKCLEEKGYKIVDYENFMKGPSWHTSIKIKGSGESIDINKVLQDCKECKANTEVKYSYTGAINGSLYNKTKVMEWGSCEQVKL